MHFVGAEGLVQVAVEPMIPKVLVHIVVDGGSEGDSGDILVDIPDLSEQFLAVHQGHFEVNQQDIIGLALEILDRKSTRLNSSHLTASRMPSSA